LLRVQESSLPQPAAFLDDEAHLGLVRVARTVVFSIAALAAALNGATIITKTG
jgi:hypothetical protein